MVSWPGITLNGRSRASATDFARVSFPLPPHGIMSKLKVLYFAADPLSAMSEQPRLTLDREAREIEEEVNAAFHREKVDFISHWATRTTDLRRELLRERPTIVHFSGHGGSQGLVLESDDGRPHRVDAEALRKFFGAFRGQIRVVVLNACHSRPQAEAIAQTIGCAIGTPSRISDEDARTFSKAFYSSIAFGESVGAAFHQACATLAMHACPDDEIPELLVGEDVDASTLVLIPEDPGVQAPSETATSGDRAWPTKRATRAGAAVALAGAAVFAVAAAVRPNPACAPAREVQRAAMQAATSSTRPSAPDENRPGAPEVAHAKTLHAAGQHTTEFAFFKQAAEAGSIEAMTTLGLAYLYGEGTPANAASGLYWLRRAADKDDPRAMNALGEAYERRVGVTRDSDYLAAQRYRAAADLGHAEAMRNLATLYRDGRGVEGSASAALEWYVKSARAGIVDAMVDVGRMHEEGQAVPPDMEIAMCWYRAAADAGSAEGRAILAAMDGGAGRSDGAGDSVRD